MTDLPPPVPPPEPRPQPPSGPPVAPPPGYTAAGGYPSSYPGQQTRTNGFAVASLVLGIVAVGLCFIVVPSLLAIIFGAVALGQIKNQPTIYTGRGMAVAGLVLGIVALLLLVLVAVTASVDYNFGDGR